MGWNLWNKLTCTHPYTHDAGSVMWYNQPKEKVVRIKSVHKLGTSSRKSFSISYLLSFLKSSTLASRKTWWNVSLTCKKIKNVSSFPRPRPFPHKFFKNWLKHNEQGSWKVKVGCGHA
jgi:hypothetical protein